MSPSQAASQHRKLRPGGSQGRLSKCLESDVEQTCIFGVTAMSPSCPHFPSTEARCQLPFAQPLVGVFPREGYV